MINMENYSQALHALQRLIIHCKSEAHNSGHAGLADLLNDIELLPEFLAEKRDCTADFIEMLQSIARVHPQCRYIWEEFEGTLALASAEKHD